MNTLKLSNPSIFHFAAVAGLAVFAMADSAPAQSVAPIGTEYSILGARQGDQVLPSLALTPTGGVVTWQDPFVYGKGLGVGLATLSQNYVGTGVTPGNSTKVGDHGNAKVKILRGGQTAVVWQTQALGTTDIFGRWFSGSKAITSDIRLNTYQKDQQITPALDALQDGGAIVTWASYGEDGSYWGVFARKFNAKGVAASAKEFQVNQYSLGNQREPAVAALANGNYVIVWISEDQRFAGSKDIYGRIFTSGGQPVTQEFLLNTHSNFCSTPAVSALNNGGFTAAWSEKANEFTNGWDVSARPFSANGAPLSDSFLVNTWRYGDQYRPQLAAGPNGVLAVWTSMGEDGSQEGVFGRFIVGGMMPTGNEFEVNTTAVSEQIHPAVAWNGVDRFVVIWSSMTLGSGFDLYGQQYGLAPSFQADKFPVPAGIPKH